VTRRPGDDAVSFRDSHSSRWVVPLAEERHHDRAVEVLMTALREATRRTFPHGHRRGGAGVQKFPRGHWLGARGANSPATGSGGRPDESGALCLRVAPGHGSRSRPGSAVTSPSIQRTRRAARLLAPVHARDRFRVANAFSKFPLFWRIRDSCEENSPHVATRDRIWAVSW
jgi:hypothetical protein